MLLGLEFLFPLIVSFLKALILFLRNTVGKKITYIDIDINIVNV